MLNKMHSTDFTVAQNHWLIKILELINLYNLEYFILTLKH